MCSALRYVMTDRISEIIASYQCRVMDMSYVPATSYGRSSHGRNGIATKFFLTLLFSDKALSLQFLKDVGLLPAKMMCPTCRHDMSWCADLNRKDGYRYRCRRRTSASGCSVSMSIRHGSWFQHSNLTLAEVIFLTYDIVRRVPAHAIQREHHFSSPTIADWGQYCKEVMLEYVKGSPQRLGGPNKTVEIDESKFGRRKHGKGEQWVFGGVERESGKTFLVPVQDRTADTLMAVISDWVEPGTTVVSDYSVAYRDLEAHGYTHETVHRTIGFVDQQTGAHINTIHSTFGHVKAYLNAYNRKKDYIYDLAQYMFTARCRAENVDEFTKFIHIVSIRDWSYPPSHNDTTDAT